MPAKKSEATEIVVPTIRQTTVAVPIVGPAEGTSGLYCHRMSAKAKRQLMIGGRKKSAAERLEIKHDPRVEFIDSMYLVENFHEFSHVAFPAMAFKQAMGTAALAVPGVRKTDVQRLVFMPDEYVPIYGIPRLRMDIARSSDINRTPDVRTRAYFDQWATQLTIRFSPPLTSQAIVALLANAGLLCGVGDNRQEKGKGSYGTFKPVGESEMPDALLDREAQWAAIESPEPANEETAALLAEFDNEVAARA